MASSFGCSKASFVAAADFVGFSTAADLSTVDSDNRFVDGGSALILAEVRRFSAIVVRTSYEHRS
jgi:hypothetical protein